MGSLFIESTGDEFKSSRLERMLVNFTNSYKLYWLQSIFDEVITGNQEMSFAHVATCMIANAWYPVNFFHLNFGLQDQLGKAVSCCKDILDLSLNEDKALIVEAIEASDDIRICKVVRDLYRYVPYRLIRPFYADSETLRGLNDNQAQREIIRLNSQDTSCSIYQIDDEHKTLVVRDDWMRYLKENELVIRGWLDMKLVEFLQARNPSVPAISLKIKAPQQRNLSDATKYWREAVSTHEFQEIYTEIPLIEENFGKYGPLSIDHFIPWSFVLHDEPWNLIPMFRDTNSSKNDRLPDISTCLDAFCKQQFDALMTLRNTGRHKKIFDRYLAINVDISGYERNNGSLSNFSKIISNSVVPLHQIAANQGFSTWKPSVDYWHLKIETSNSSEFKIQARV